MVAESLGGKASLRMGNGWRLAAAAQQWWDGGEWLESQYDAELHLDVTRWVRAKDSELVLSAEVHDYNLDIYPHSENGGQPVLGWNDDLLIRLSYSLPWAR